MEVPELRWETSVFQDPDGGSAILWPYLPCVRMPMKMRPREWDALALLSSSDDSFLLERGGTGQGEPGSSFGICDCIRHYIRDASPRPFRTPIRGPAIPDPERIRLLRHAENSRGGCQSFPLNPVLMIKNGLIGNLGGPMSK